MSSGRSVRPGRREGGRAGASPSDLIQYCYPPEKGVSYYMKNGFGSELFSDTSVSLK